jgi:hypothetical protein
MFQTCIVKVDLDVAMVIHAYSKGMFYLFQLYVVNFSFLYFKSRSGIAHVAMHADDWRTCRNRLVLLRGRRRDSVQARDGRGRPGASDRVRSWLTCEREGQMLVRV